MKLRNKKTGEIKEYTHTMTSYHVPIKGGYEIFTPWYPEEWEELEDVKEPLIKDPKNSKVVRAWLEANDLDGATFHTSSRFFHYWNLRGFNDNGQGVDIDFFLTGEGIPNLIDGKYYTKFELCGEEEE